MKLFVLSFLLLSICCGLNARCLSGFSGDCLSRIFPEPEPRPIHYIYHGESCNCPKYHDLIVQKPQIDEKPIEQQSLHYELNISQPEVKKEAEKDGKRYLFDVRIEKPVEPKPERPSASYNYQLQEAPQVHPEQQKNSIRYIFDSRVEKPIKPCAEKPWQGLVTQIDAVLVPQKPATCGHPNHASGGCNCGCRNPSHTPSTCDCNRDLFNIPTFLSPDETSHKRIKRDTKSKSNKLSLSLKHPDIKLPKLKPLKKLDAKPLKKLEPKELKSVFKIESHKKQKSTTTPKPFKLSSNKQSLRLKRKEKSPCGYEFESCDLKRKTPAGCPLCYKCHCEPSGDADNQRFSPKDVKIPYRIVSHDQEFSPATQQEFDHEPPSYTGLNRPDMYKQYIEQIISKYPEHMSRRMPNIMDQQRDLMDFINDLAKHDRSPPDEIARNVDTRYQIIDDAAELYKMYENAVSRKPSPFGNRKLFNKRGTVLEVIEVDPEDLKNGNFKLPEFDESSYDDSST